MKALYGLQGFSKQAHWAWVERQARLSDEWLLLEAVVAQWRADHPSMGLKKLYTQIQPDFVGVNTFIDYCMAHGWEAVSYRKKPRTTLPASCPCYPNLLADRLISGINQVWVSDITYFKVAHRWYYLTFIMDLYSRRIVGYHAAAHLLAQANLQALDMAFEQRATHHFDQGLLHHSDRGAQYKSHRYTQALRDAGMRLSMGRIVYDNIHCERLHQTIKGEYLCHRAIQSEEQLVRHLRRSVELYNQQRPHLSLGNKTPCDFERDLINVPLCQRTLMRVFAAKDKPKIANPHSPVLLDPRQLKLPFV